VLPLIESSKSFRQDDGREQWSALSPRGRWLSPVGLSGLCWQAVVVYSAAAIIATILVLIPLAVVGYVFVWAARKDGEEDKAVQARLGIRRRTRLGR
jgi:hypothetical protein